jgi:hypothetical protein
MKSMADPSPTQSFIATFLATARGRLITAFTVVFLAIGVLAEGFSIYQSWQQIGINTYQIEIKQVQARAASSSSAAYAIANVPPPRSERPGAGTGVLKIEKPVDCRQADNPEDRNACLLALAEGQIQMFNDKNLKEFNKEISGPSGSKFEIHLRE